MQCEFGAKVPGGTDCPAQAEVRVWAYNTHLTQEPVYEPVMVGCFCNAHYLSLVEPDADHFTLDDAGFRFSHMEAV
jgi:hypothetical protein